MLLMGLFLGFTGTGGSGLIIAILVTIFHVPVHTALGTSITAMIFTMISGVYSHIREGNVKLRTGIIFGLIGSIGAYSGTWIARWIPEGTLVWMTGAMLAVCGILIWMKTRMAFTGDMVELPLNSARFWVLALGIGLGCGLISGVFGIGSTPFIQLALLTFLRFPISLVAGTTMLIILPIAVAGALGYSQAGFLDVALLVKVVVGTVVGSYIGAKFTRRLPVAWLRYSMIVLPFVGAALLFLG
ncbi:sulfite exporter TauE/SafE family protein [Paenibacillus sp. N3.4]|uniref:sulfite exporter TauE/SafE family protein n=1 Tax=Paenibacillus sp. N3.4 TaxID=2603222 RepID=UPI0021C362AD|nr:sulfite exporter TauE/SafE family protein [Paenibacillus sp. N3.4]